jgi:hypothetical protein
MEFPAATVTSVKANFATKRITVAFTLAINEGSMAAADKLAEYTAKDAGPVDLVITPRQLPLFKIAGIYDSSEKESGPV